MKENRTLPGLLLVTLTACCITFLFAGCKKDQSTNKVKYTIYKPVLKPKAEILAAVNGNASRPVAEAGKIYIKDNFIYLNEVDKGIHIINNSNPAFPLQVAFLEIPGNRDIAVRGHMLYADMYGDLLAIDISNPKKVTVKNRLPGFFTERMYPNGIYVDSALVAVDWIKKDTLVEQGVYYYPGTGFCPGCAFDFALANAPAPQNINKSNGTAGSMAAMVLINDYLYAVSERHTLSIVDITHEEAPVKKTSFFAGFDLETIYPFEDKIFMGSAAGMFMYDVSNPEAPVKLGEFSHGRACDPVVTDGEYAYVTLHSGTGCGGDANELNVVNVKDLMNPSLVKSYTLTKPTGLCKDGNLLFVCDDKSGVRVYNAADPSNLKQLQQIASNEPYDVIAANKHALVVAKDGLYQYDYSNLNNIRRLSFFSLKK